MDSVPVPGDVNLASYAAVMSGKSRGAAPARLGNNSIRLSEQKRIRDALFAEHMIPPKLRTTGLKVRTRKGP